MVEKLKDRRVAALLALVGAVSPVSGWHKFYLGQPGWGCLYLTLSLVDPWNPIPRIASLMEAVWYLFHTEGMAEGLEQGLFLPLGSGQDGFPFSGIGSKAHHSAKTAQHITAIGEALRELEGLRQEGLISEYEFEQKRRQLLEAE